MSFLDLLPGAAGLVDGADRPGDARDRTHDPRRRREGGGEPHEVEHEGDARQPVEPHGGPRERCGDDRCDVDEATRPVELELIEDEPQAVGVHLPGVELCLPALSGPVGVAGVARRLHAPEGGAVGFFRPGDREVEPLRLLAVHVLRSFPFPSGLGIIEMGREPGEEVIVVLISGNDFADSMLERRLSQAPEYWALIDYLESQGVLNREEFLKFLVAGCERFVKDVEEARASTND